MSKIRIVVNKHVKCSLTAKAIVEGIATYTSFDFRTFEQLFDPSSVPCYILPLMLKIIKIYRYGI